MILSVPIHTNLFYTLKSIIYQNNLFAYVFVDLIDTSQIVLLIYMEKIRVVHTICMHYLSL